MPNTARSVNRLVATAPNDRASAARLAAEVDPSSEFGATVREVFEEVANGAQLVILRSDQEVTPAGAAELLGVTRQFVDRLLLDGLLKFRHLPNSKHRRIRIEDVLALAEERDRRRQAADTIRAAFR